MPIYLRNNFPFLEHLNFHMININFNCENLRKNNLTIFSKFYKIKLYEEILFIQQIYNFLIN